MMSSKDSKALQINRCSVDSITLYEITEQELELLEQGSPSSTLLNFAIFSLSIGLAFFATLLTVEIKDNRIFQSFLLLTVVGLLAGLILLVIWRRTAKSTAGVVAKIKARAVGPVTDTDNRAPIQAPPAFPGPAQAG